MNEKHHVKYEASAEFKAVTIVSEHKNRFKCSDVPCVGFFSTVTLLYSQGYTITSARRKMQPSCIKLPKKCYDNGEVQQGRTGRVGDQEAVP